MITKILQDLTNTPKKRSFIFNLFEITLVVYIILVHFYFINDFLAILSSFLLEITTAISSWSTVWNTYDYHEGNIEYSSIAHKKIISFFTGINIIISILIFILNIGSGYYLYENILIWLSVIYYIYVRYFSKAYKELPEEFKKITDTEITDTIDKTFNKSFEFIDNLGKKVDNFTNKAEEKLESFGKKEDVKNKDNNNN